MTESPNPRLQYKDRETGRRTVVEFPDRADPFPTFQAVWDKLNRQADEPANKESDDDVRKRS